MFVLGIDTSCDDTSIALLEEGTRLVSNLVSSQIELHRVFGGVVPEIASRRHIERIGELYLASLGEAKVSPDAIDVIGVTAGPGLIGSVLVGLCFAKGLALALKKPLVAVNHVEAHAMSIFLERNVPFPFIALVVSGGHTLLLQVNDFCRYKTIGSTRDDAVGEAFDKIAKFLGLGYPGGRVIEDLSRGGKRDYVVFPRPMADEKNYDFSFSGLKTSMLNYVKKHGISNLHQSDILASFQEAALDVLVEKTVRAAKESRIGRIVVGGGVASNGRLRELFGERGLQESVEVFFSSPEFCTDNGAMIAKVAHSYYERGCVSPLSTRAYSRMQIR